MAFLIYSPGQVLRSNRTERCHGESASWSGWAALHWDYKKHLRLQKGR